MSQEQQEINRKIADNPKTASPYRPQRGLCGHCGSGEVEAQAYDFLCRACGKYSDLDGNPEDGCPRHRANTSVSFPWVNDYLDRMK